MWRQYTIFTKINIWWVDHVKTDMRHMNDIVNYVT